MKEQLQAAAAVIRSYAVARSIVGVPRWYVYRRAAVKGGEIPPDSPTFFSSDRAQAVCDELNAWAVIEVWRRG